VIESHEAEEGHASVDDRCHACSDGRRRWIERIYRVQGLPNDGWEARSFKEQAVIAVWTRQDETIRGVLVVSGESGPSARDRYSP
jgi:hypothetical protein